MANKNRKIYGFFATKICFFLRKKYFDVPHAIGVLVRIFVEPITPGLSQRGRLLGAVAQWQLRLCFLRRRAKRGALLFAFSFFFAKTWHPSAFVKVSAIFLLAYFSETIQNFKKRSASECPFWPCKKVPKIFRLGDYISFENMIFAKIFRVFSDFA